MLATVTENNHTATPQYFAVLSIVEWTGYKPQSWIMNKNCGLVEFDVTNFLLFIATTSHFYKKSDFFCWTDVILLILIVFLWNNLKIVCVTWKSYHHSILIEHSKVSCSNWVCPVGSSDFFLVMTASQHFNSTDLLQFFVFNGSSQIIVMT